MDSVGGLDKRKSDGEWVRGQPIPDASIINLCDIFQKLLGSMYQKPYRTIVEYLSLRSELNKKNSRILSILLLFPSAADFTRLFAIYSHAHSPRIVLIEQAISMGEIDPTFILDPEFRPKLEYIEAEEIPVINLSNFSNNDIEELVSEIGSACKNWGFFQVINHGVPLELRQRMEKVAKEFFHLGSEEKKKVELDEFNSAGYHDSEHTRNVRDWKEVFDFYLEDQTTIPASHEPDDEELRTVFNQWPHYPTSFRETCQEYAREVEKLGFKLLELISLSLGLPADRCHPYFKHQTSLVTLTHYPPCPAPHLVLGVGGHRDAGALTILAQDDVGGLEVKRKSDGEWVRIKPIPNAFIINVGDVVQVWSNDAYESVEHRVVVNSEKARISIPFFIFPSHTVSVRPFDELVNQQNPSKYKDYNWGKFIANRNRSDYKNQTFERIHIEHFKVSE